jgi:hypothetical protein
MNAIINEVINEMNAMNAIINEMTSIIILIMFIISRMFMDCMVTEFIQN